MEDGSAIVYTVLKDWNTRICNGQKWRPGNHTPLLCKAVWAIISGESKQGAFQATWTQEVEIHPLFLNANVASKTAHHTLRQRAETKEGAPSFCVTLSKSSGFSPQYWADKEIKQRISVEDSVPKMKQCSHILQAPPWAMEFGMYLDNVPLHWHCEKMQITNEDKITSEMDSTSKGSEVKSEQQNA